jgi:arylsulfatase
MTALAALLLATTPADRPNVLVLMADDHRADCLGAFGHPAVRTPNLDALAGRGFAFRNAYCLGSNLPAVCTPSRNTFLGGRAYFRYPGPLAPPEGSFPAVFRAAGYETYHHGKRGNTATRIQAAFEHNRYLDEGRDRTSGEPGKAIADAAVEFLRTRDRSRPFFAYLGFEAPHDPRVAADRYRRLYDPAKLPLPANFLPRHPFDNGEMAVRDELLLPWPRTPDAVRKELHDYYSVVTALDGHVGRVLAALNEQGLDRNTYVVYSSDHGLALGSHGLLGKQSLYEHSMKAPLVVAGPGIRPGSSDALAYLMDIFPTACDLTGVRPPAGLDGASLTPVIAGAAPAVRDAVLTAYRDVQRAVRTADGWKLIRYPQVDRTQLFDLTADPHERKDVSTDPANAGRVQALTAKLTELQKQYGDTQSLTAASPKPAEWTPPAGEALKALRARWKMDPPPAKPARKPDVVVVLTDDMGFSDLGCYGGEIATPNLDALAAGGVRFTQFYNTARCCPTRASLLTGRYPHQAGVGHMVEDKGHPGYRGDLSRDTPTLAEALKPAGYRSYAVGKWHVTPHTGPAGPKHNWPRGRGFDRFYGTIAGAGSYFDPGTLTRDDTQVSPFADPDYTPAEYYYTDAITDHAVRYVADHARDHADRPMLLYVAYTAAHWPMHARPADLAKYRGKYAGGYEPVRRARLATAARLGLIDPKQGVAPLAADWAAVPDKAWEAAGMEAYAAIVDRMDQGVGKIVAELKRVGRLDDTLILYMQDNGGCAEGIGRTATKKNPGGDRPANPTLPPQKPTDLIPAGTPAQTRDGFPVRMGPRALPGPADTYVAYGPGWATVSNTPFREYKHWVHEGGISTPLIAHWPKGIPADRRGALATAPGHLIDVMATARDLAGVPDPAPEGVSLRPAFAGRPLDRPQPLFWEHEGNKAIRVGDWKLVAKHGRPWELYDLATDRVEARNQAAAEPDRVRQMAGQWDAWAARVGVRPWPVAKQ